MKIRFTLGTNTDGESIKLPVIPPSFNENFTDKIEYFTSINGLEHSIYKPAGARNLTFESYFPFTSSDPLATGSSWEEPMFYVNFFQEAERNLQPVRLTITEELSRDLDSADDAMVILSSEVVKCNIEDVYITTKTEYLNPDTLIDEHINGYIISIKDLSDFIYKLSMSLQNISKNEYIVLKDNKMPKDFVSYINNLRNI